MACGFLSLALKVARCRMSEFAAMFEALTGHQHYAWQAEVFHSLVKGALPSNLALPTGAGKTSVIPVWLLALCENPTLPRRLFYVVDRRSVVDQVTNVIEQIAASLATPALTDVRN